MEAEIRFPTPAGQLAGPGAHTAPGRNPAEAMCVSTCRTLEGLGNHLWGSYSSPPYAALPKPEAQAAMEEGRKKWTLGHRANALQLPGS